MAPLFSLERFMLVPSNAELGREAIYLSSLVLPAKSAGIFALKNGTFNSLDKAFGRWKIFHFLFAF